MGNRKQRKAKSVAKWKRYTPWGLGISGAIAIGVYLVVVLGHTDRLIPITKVIRVDDRTLLVAGTSGSDVDVRRWSAIAMLGPDGVLRHRVDETGDLRLLGVDGDRVWLDHGTRKIHTRTLPTLALEAEYEVAIAGHPALSHGYQINGVAGRGLVLAAVNGRRFVLDPGHPIQASDGVGMRPIGEMGRVADPERAEMTYAAARKALENLALDDAIIVGEATGPVVFENPPGYLVRSFELVVGGTLQALHRVGADGTVAWSTTAAALLDIAVDDHQSVALAWAGWLGGELTVLVQLSEARASSEEVYTEHTQWLLGLDPDRGTVTSKRKVSAPQE